MMKKIWIAILVFISGCAATKNFVPAQESLSSMQQKVPGITLERANQGYALYKQKCAGCHPLHSPSEKTSIKWEKTLHEMFPKAKVTNEDEKQLIKDYLFALSK